MIIFNTRKTV